MNRRRLFLYLLLNVFISACVTGSILYWYDRNYRATLSPVGPVVPVVGQEELTTPASQYQPDEQIPVEIVSVVGAGTLGAEVIVIRYNGEGELGLSGWQLQDSQNNTFTFPQLVLYTNGAVQVHTATGTDTVVDLYWGQREAVWQSGETAHLFDPQGNLRAIYQVP